MLEIALASRSECGQRSSNEDRVGVSMEGPRWLAVLADGAGGHSGGAEAARRAVEHLQCALRGASARFDADALTRAVLATHRHVLDARQTGAGPRGMHTTLVVLWIDADAGRALWSHVGDSRLYVVRRGALRQLTSDDSVVQRMVDAGLLTAQQALVHPFKNQLVSALGIDGEIEPHTPRAAVRLEPGDAFLLCSDGWWGALNEAAILGSLADADSPDEWLTAMQGAIEAQRHPRQDNFSAVAAWVGLEAA
ncbi:MAG TPA: protein phosphatase 2C domain-containing protein [Ramlibacter sp.]|uniref:PP2C family protein-serine/threonine phosphatase n=1 Tax=Ramlibacter sp. TaxID=1917967 RepID=UPI002D7F68F1|nr:protein phosphatase 2C domain-containing protein [Ramlibacter sp.]HET8744256.1 protein phosphatase 2C domain-containing protein [Ramlibacter sp.]